MEKKPENAFTANPYPIQETQIQVFRALCDPSVVVHQLVRTISDILDRAVGSHKAFAQWETFAAIA
jgi:hypothetical protein